MVHFQIRKVVILTRIYSLEMDDWNFQMIDFEAMLFEKKLSKMLSEIGYRRTHPRTDNYDFSTHPELKPPRFARGRRFAPARPSLKDASGQSGRSKMNVSQVK